MVLSILLFSHDFYFRVTNKRQPVSETCAKMAKWDMGDAGWVTGGSGIRKQKVVCGCWSVLGVWHHTGARQIFRTHSDSP